MHTLSVVGPLIAFGGFAVFASTIAHCLMRRDLGGMRLLRAMWLVLIVACASIPQPLKVTRAVINGVPVQRHVQWNTLFPKPFAEVYVVKAGGQTNWQFYESDTVILDRPRGAALVRMESRTVTIPVWFALGLAFYWIGPAAVSSGIRKIREIIMRGVRKRTDQMELQV